MTCASDFQNELAEIETDLVMILSTARTHGRGPQRLPDREDRGKRVTTFQVETNDQARSVLGALDRPDRHIYVDIERKQDLDLAAIARDVVRKARVHPTKPNDTTVDALSALLTNHIGHDVTDLPVTVFGTGNLGFKFALRLAEGGARVALTGRDSEKTRSLVDAINCVLPPFSPHHVTTSLPESGTRVFISAVTATAIIGPSWLSRLAAPSLCVDVGIGNFTPEFIHQAHQRGHTVMRLDVRCAGDPLPLRPNPFFLTVAGNRRIGDINIVGGGLIGTLGAIVVDNVTQPSLVVGVADGFGGLLPEPSWNAPMRDHVQTMRSWIIIGIPA